MYCKQKRSSIKDNACLSYDVMCDNACLFSGVLVLLHVDKAMK